MVAPWLWLQAQSKMSQHNSPNICFDYESWHSWEMLNIQNENWDIKCNLNWLIMMSFKITFYKYIIYCVEKSITKLFSIWLTWLFEDLDVKFSKYFFVIYNTIWMGKFCLNQNLDMALKNHAKKVITHFLPVRSSW